MDGEALRLSIGSFAVPASFPTRVALIGSRSGRVRGGVGMTMSVRLIGANPGLTLFDAAGERTAFASV